MIFNLSVLKFHQNYTLSFIILHFKISREVALVNIHLLIKVC